MGQLKSEFYYLLFYTMLGNILIASDFSEAANTAMGYAVQLAESTDQDIIVMYVHNDEETEPEIRARFEKLERDFIYGRGIGCTFDTRTGSVIQSIQEAVKEYDIDLVVIGTRGFGGLKEMELGSLTAEMLDHLEFPIISIPKYCKKLDLKHIALASDLIIGDHKRALKIVYELATVCNSEIKVVHVNDGREVLGEEVIMELNSIFSVVPHSYIELDEKNIAEGLLNYCNEEEVDLLITLRKQQKESDQRLIGSISKQLSLRGNVPLMVIPSGN